MGTNGTRYDEDFYTWTQEQAAEKLGVTQAYLSMLEHGHRVLPSSLTRKAVEVLQASPTTLPLREETFGTQFGTERGSEKLRAELAALGYPGFAHRFAHLGGEGEKIPRRCCSAR